MSDRRHVMAGIVVMAALVAGCSSGGGSSQAKGTAPAAGTPAAATTAAATSAAVATSQPAPPPTSAAATTAAPTTTTSPTPKPTVKPTPKPDPRFHRYDRDAGVVAFLAYVKNHEQAMALQNPNYPQLINSALHVRWQTDADDMTRRLKAGQHYVPGSVERVLGVSSTGASNRSLRVCESNYTGKWLDKAGKPADTYTSPWVALNVQMALDAGVWKAASISAGNFSCKGVK